MSATVLEPLTRPRFDGGAGSGGGWHIIVLNDEVNTFDGVAEALSGILPEVSLADGYRLASEVDSNGQAIVWSGNRDEAQGYWDQLNDYGLTMAPLEQG
jgi:ATP-dependent Clp protease adaptor protein ClpS